MKKALSEIQKVTTNEGKHVFVSIVQKQSDLGVTYNKRLLVLVQNVSFGYISEVKQTDDLNNINVNKCKITVPIKHLLREPERNKQLLSINFFTVQNGKRINKNWLLKMSSENLAIQWQKIFTNEIEKSALRKNNPTGRANQQSPNNESKINNQNNPHINKSQNKLSKPSNMTVEEQRSKIKQQIKKEFEIERVNQKPKQDASYINQLYQSSNQNKLQKGNFILDQLQSPNNTLQNVQRKLQYQNQLNLSKQKAQKQMQLKRAEQERKKQIQKKQKQLAERQLMVRQKQKKLLQTQQKRLNYAQNSNTKQLRQESKILQSDIYDINKQQRYKESQIKESTVNKNKLNANKYGDLVDNVIYGKNSNDDQAWNQKFNKQNDKASQIQQLHDHLFQLQKIKLNQNKLEKTNSPNKSEIGNQIKQQKQKQILSQFGWTYKYLVKEENGQQYQTITQFSQHCANILKSVVEQFHLPDRKKKYVPKYRNQQYYLYESNDIQFKIALIDLKQVYSQDQVNSRNKVCDQKTIKQLQAQFKCFNTLYRILKQSKARVLRVPLCALCEYHGFVALFKALSQYDNQTNAEQDRRIQLDIQQMNQKSKLNFSILKTKQNAHLFKLNNNFYKQLSASLGNFYAKFDYVMIWEIKKLFPIDILITKNPKQIKQSTERVGYLREQLVNNYVDNSELNSEHILYSFNKKQRKFQGVQPSDKLKQQLQKLSQALLIAISKVIKQLDNLQQYYLHPQELSNLMHSNGINIRYLGLIYEHSSLGFTKSYIISQVAARMCKALFRKTLQDISLEQQTDFANNSYASSMRFKLIDFFNCLLGSSIQTQAIWDLLSAHSLNYFNVPLNLGEIQKGYFLTSLLYHCNVQINWSKIKISHIFQTDSFFNEETFTTANIKIKAYDPILSQQQHNLISLIDSQEAQAFKILQNVHKIQQKKLPNKLRHKQYVHNIRKYAANFVSPDTTNFREQKNLNLYGDEPLLTKAQYQIKFIQLRWYLKKQRKQKYIITFSKINQAIVSAYGDFHPLLSELYDIMSAYHKNNGEYEDAITFSKSSVINMLKICGSTHPRVGECYYQLAICCIKANKKQQALVSLQKAKTIFEVNHKQQNVAYAHVCLKLGLLFLSERKIEQTQKIINFALNNFNDHMKSAYDPDNPNLQINVYESERVQCYELLARCYQLTQNSKQKQKDLGFEVQKQIKYIKEPSNLQKMFKIVLYPMLGSLSTQSTQIYLNIISQLPSQSNVSQYMKGFSCIHERVQQQTLIDNISNYFENLNAIDKFIKQNNSLKDWNSLSGPFERQTVNDFLSLTEEIICFLGEGFVTGALRDNL